MSHRIDLPPLQRRQYIASVQNAALFLFILMFIVIWLEQVRTIAAIVLATKEFILNISGFFSGHRQMPCPLETGSKSTASGVMSSTRFLSE